FADGGRDGSSGADHPSSSDGRTAADGTLETAGDGGIEAASPDAPMKCTVSADCTSLDTPLCIAGVCQPCSAAHAPDSECARLSNKRPYCDVTNGRCGACINDAQCTDANNPFCLANQCVACFTTGIAS